MERGVSDALAVVVRRINAAHGTAFVLGARFRWGEQGAFRLRDAGGDGYVLKWQPGETGGNRRDRGSGKGAAAALRAYLKRLLCTVKAHVEFGNEVHLPKDHRRI